MAIKKNPDLHGNVPDTSDVALILIDVINDFNFPEAEQLLEYAMPMAQRLTALKKRCKQLGIPAIYANDNFGIWRSDFRQVLEHCLEPGSKGRELTQLLKPEEDDYFVLKPKHSGFFSTTLGILLDYLQCHTLILTGIAGNICVLFTANDAYMRDFKLIVPSDCVASNTREENDHALDQMQKVLKADIGKSERLLAAELALSKAASSDRHHR